MAYYDPIKVIFARLYVAMKLVFIYVKSHGIILSLDKFFIFRFFNLSIRNQIMNGRLC